MNKLHFSLAAAAIAAPLAWWWAGIPHTDSAENTPQALGAPAASNPLPPVDLELPRRALSAPSHDPFGTPARPPQPARIALAEVAPVPTAPPLPYQYDGSGEVQGKSFVFLKRKDLNFRVSAGDTLEGTYAVEALARDHVVLRYLPLGIRQVLMYKPGAAVPPELAAATDPSQPVALQVDMPAEVVLGQEFVVTLGLAGGGALKATVEVGYDAEVLRVVGANVRRPGRAIIEVASGGTARAQLRFKVLVEWPVSTDIDLQVNATDASGKRVAVSAPSQHSVNLVLPGA